MNRSTERILTTHVGSLARPTELLDTLKERENGRPYDADLLDRQITDAVADRVRQPGRVGHRHRDGRGDEQGQLPRVRQGPARWLRARHGPVTGGAVVAEGGRRLPRVLRRVLQEVRVHRHAAAPDHLQGPDQLRRPRARPDGHRQPQGGGRAVRRLRCVHALDRAERLRPQRVLPDPRGVPQRRCGGDARGVPRHRRRRLRPPGRRPLPHRHAQRPVVGAGRAASGRPGSTSRR